MTNQRHPITPPPHLLKKFSERARVDSQKRGHAGYCKTFAKLCIDWAFQEAAMDDLRVASAEVSGVELNSQPSPNDRQIRSLEIRPPFELVQQWFAIWQSSDDEELSFADFVVPRAAQWGSDQELEACCRYFIHDLRESLAGELRAARRPKPPSLKEQALAELAEWENVMDIAPDSPIRQALEQLDD